MATNPFYLSDIRRLQASKQALTGRNPDPALYDRLLGNELNARYEWTKSEQDRALRERALNEDTALRREALEQTQAAATGSLLTTGPLYLMGAYKMGKEAGVGDMAVKGYDYVKDALGLGKQAIPSTAPTTTTSSALTGVGEYGEAAFNGLAGETAAATGAATGSGLGAGGGALWGAGSQGAALTGSTSFTTGASMGLTGAGANTVVAAPVAPSVGLSAYAGPVGWGYAAGSAGGRMIPEYITHEKPTAGRGAAYGAMSGAAAGAAAGSVVPGIGTVVGGVVGAVVGAIGGAISGSK